MQPDVLPLRVFFVPHWKYVVNTFTSLHLHVPTGYTSAMFSHLPSRTVFIDADRYGSTNPLVIGWLTSSDTSPPAALAKTMLKKRPTNTASA